MNSYSDLNKFTAAQLKNARLFFTKRGALDKAYIQDPVMHEEFKGQRGEFISNGGKHMAIKRIGFYGENFVMVTCPTCYAKFFDNIQLIKNMTQYEGMEMLTYRTDSPNKNKVAGDPEHYVLMFTGNPTDIIKRVDKILASEVDTKQAKSKKQVKKPTSNKKQGENKTPADKLTELELATKSNEK